MSFRPLFGSYSLWRRAVKHLAGNPDVVNQLLDGEAVDSVQRVAAHTAGTDPEVETSVATGPTDEILKFFDIADSKNGTVLAVDFCNWSGPVCRR